jgi:hypothetical protein
MFAYWRIDSHTLPPVLFVTSAAEAAPLNMLYRRHKCLLHPVRETSAGERGHCGENPCCSMLAIHIPGILRLRRRMRSDCAQDDKGRMPRENSLKCHGRNWHSRGFSFALNFALRNSCSVGMTKGESVGRNPGPAFGRTRVFSRP